MDTENICDTDAFKDTPECKKQQWSIFTNLGWAFFLIVLAFFTRTWWKIIDKLVKKVFGSYEDGRELTIMAALSLFLLLTVSHCFSVNLSYN